MFRRHPVLSAITLAYLAVVGWLTLGPQPLDDHGDGLLRRVLEELDRHPATAWVTYSGVEFAANILMFVPAGLFFLLLLGRRRWVLAVLLGLAMTCAIEAAQLLLPDRVSDPRDIVANSLGGLLGVLVALRWTRPRRKRRARAERARPGW
ncbi:VanZ family protein [Homoserinibacter sp. YIM 151385]|uniref:VanZ family protein n=1 Tax=Homoserinibacter sp. YIM 151385 TaxID=2985506 RepID=UPI0022F0D950|nr:VanZ family protein [Homoserinibacter sp. YIM 151385]WBU38397.1 VanZ family protein [Homoserinibacter sp. YIM 151385]